MATNTGHVKTLTDLAPVVPFPYQVTLGRVPGFSRVVANGRNSVITLGADIWEGGVGAYPLLANASKLEILSASALDTLLGTGAQSFMIQGLDANFNPISETVSMSGVAPVQTANSYLRVNRLLIASAGAGLANAGAVTLRVTGAGAIQALAAAGLGQAKMAVYTVPAGSTLLLTEMEFDIAGAVPSSSVTYGVTRQTPSGILWIQGEFVVGATSALERIVTTGARVEATNTVSIRATAVTGTTAGHAAFEGILVDNAYVS